MDLSPIGLARVLLPQTPLLLKTAVLNTLYLSANSSKQDLRTELAVNLIRALIRKPDAIGKMQKGSLRAPAIKGKMWISKVTLPKPEDTEGVTIRDALDIAIKELGDGNETYTLPDVSAVEAEWTGYRSGVGANAARPNMSEEEHYKHLMSEVKSDVTTLYFHGGIHFLMDPATHRIPTSNLARLTSGRCLSIRYRLAPQNPFPSALLDALTAYLSLLSPPPSSLHAAIPASHIVFAGDSAGGNLSLALLQTLLTLQRKGIHSLRFHGRDVALSLPAGLSLNSPWCDVSRSMPSCRSNARYDYIGAPAAFSFDEEPPADDVWPAAPPRLDLYAHAPTLTHPLVSPLATPAPCWTGAPPVYMCAGNEGLEDEIAVVARRMHQVGVRVWFDGYEGQPHCFGMIFPQYTPGKECVAEWAGFMRDVVEGKVQREFPEGGRATWAKALSNPVHRVEVSFAELKKELGDDEVEALMRTRRERFVEKEKEMQREWREEQERSRGQAMPKL